MNRIIVLSLILLSSYSFAGVGGGGGGVLPSMNVFSLQEGFSKELVRVLEVRRDSIALLHKPKGSYSSQVIELPSDSIDPAYTDIIFQSWNQKSWVEISQ